MLNLQPSVPVLDRQDRLGNLGGASNFAPNYPVQSVHSASFLTDFAQSTQNALSSPFSVHLSASIDPKTSITSSVDSSTTSENTLTSTLSTSTSAESGSQIKNTKNGHSNSDSNGSNNGNNNGNGNGNNNGNEIDWSSLLSFFVAGGVAGAASRTVVSPLERLKILLQVQGAKTHEYTGVFQGLVKMWKDEGWRGYFRGNGINVIRIAPYSAVQFTTYEQLKKLLTWNGTREMDTPRRLTAGALAGIASVVSTYPLDLVRSRLSIVTASIGKIHMSPQQHLSIWQMTKHVYKTENGLYGLYRGLVPTAAGVAPYVGLNFACYELFRTYFQPSDGSQPGHFRKLCCGALAGSVSQTLTYPLDVLRRRMQVVGLSTMEYQYDSATQAVKVIVQKEGIRGLYKGLWPNLLKVAPSIGTSFVTYEAVKGFLIE